MLKKLLEMCKKELCSNSAIDNILGIFASKFKCNFDSSYGNKIKEALMQSSLTIAKKLHNKVRLHELMPDLSFKSSKPKVNLNRITDLQAKQIFKDCISSIRSEVQRRKTSSSSTMPLQKRCKSRDGSYFTLKYDQ